MLFDVKFSYLTKPTTFVIIYLIISLHFSLYWHNSIYKKFQRTN